MPEKITEKVEANGRPIPEITPQKVEETARKYMQQAGTTAQDAARVYNDLLSTTTKFYFDMLGTTIRDGMEMSNKTQHAMEDVLTTYRRYYTEGFKAWQGYWQDVNKMVLPPK